MTLRLAQRHTLFPSAIDRAVHLAAGAAPDQADAAMKAVQTAMQALLEQPGDLPAWCLSTLTSDGFPCELTFTTTNDALRLTCETGPPRSGLHGRLKQVKALAARLAAGGGVSAPVTSPVTSPVSGPVADTISGDEPVLRQVKSWQALGALEFGAWLGLRIRPDGRTGAKIYAEIPEAAQPAVLQDMAARFGVAPGLPGRSQSLRMIGFTPGEDTLEYYFAVHELQPWEIGALMHPVGLHARRQEVLPVFESALGRAMHHALPSPVFGFSYALNPSAPPVFSFYAFADHLFRSDAAARTRILDFLQRHELKLEGYEAVSEPLQGEASGAHGHGLFGVALCADLAPVIHVGLRPPQPLAVKPGGPGDA